MTTEDDGVSERDSHEDMDRQTDKETDSKIGKVKRNKGETRCRKRRNEGARVRDKDK